MRLLSIPAFVLLALALGRRRRLSLLETAPWLLCDLSLHKKTLMPTHSGHRVKTPELDVGITCYNLLDQSYQVVQGYPMPGIHLMLSVSYAW